MKLKKSLSAVLIFMLLAIISVPVSAKTRVTYSKFLKIKMGSSYSAVVKIVGKGKRESSTSTAGIKMTSYTWSAGLGAMSITFQNGKVLSKGQAGLYKAYAKVSKRKYKKIKSGMSYKKVKSILGKGGQLTGEAKSYGSDSRSYQWVNSNGYFITCTFSNNVLDVKSDFSL
ncbi:DUF3862 domain-containing protein [Clostridium oryzae]|uniref:Beta-lactamase inhibitor (BLIP) n=1 Tax=Clostridium oryzae TaxID=1450648 RepID=A0A1V4IWZ8_9CLOT|nr:DUF3862 domain-containing protein [Clostridium oryzae]OPJ64582.1 beta-lactamase inhibitor (BLIP) [Clostridium oryzae]